MIGQRTLVLLALAAVAALAGACSTVPIARSAPELAQATREPTAQTEATPIPTLSAGDNGKVVASAEPEQTSTPETVPTPAPTLDASMPEEDCMAECHLPDPNDYFAAGAKPLPASHAGRTTCLVCHATAAAPVLPATHLGRLDESCRGCHASDEQTEAN